MIARRIARVALLVRDDDAAIDWHARADGFRVLKDRPLPERGKRRVVIGPDGGSGGCNLLLARAATPEQARCIGDQAGGRGPLFPCTDDSAPDDARLHAACARCADGRAGAC